MTLPYERATAGASALAEIQRTLEAFGCGSFGTMTDNDRSCIVVAFKHRGRAVQLEANWNGYAALWLKHHPWSNNRSRKSRVEYERSAIEQAKIAVCSILRDWVKGQTAAVECGVMSFEAVFMPHLLLADGRRVIDAAREAKWLPALEHVNGAAP